MSQSEQSGTDAPRGRSFSLRGLLVAIAVLCGLLASYLAWREIDSSRQELEKLREETGRLTIEDRGKIQAVAVATDEPNTWRWRLFIPKGHKYRWKLASEEIPQLVPPKKAAITATSNEPYWERDNEVLVTARLQQLNDDEWQLSVDSKIGDSRNQMSGGKLKIPDEKIRWMREVSSTDGQVLGENGTRTLEPAGPIILLQRRPCEKQPDGSYSPSAGPMPGFMIWLEEW